MSQVNISTVIILMNIFISYVYIVCFVNSSFYYRYYIKKVHLFVQRSNEQSNHNSQQQTTVQTPPVRVNRTKISFFCSFFISFYDCFFLSFCV